MMYGIVLMVLHIIISGSFLQCADLYEYVDTQDCTVELIVEEDQKRNCVCNAFTSVDAWNCVFTQGAPILSYRVPKTERQISRKLTPTIEDIAYIVEYIETEKLKSSQTFTVMCKLADYTFIGSDDGTLYTAQKNGDSIVCSHVQACHDSSIAALYCITDRWLAVGGGKTITFYSIKDCKGYERVSPLKMFNIQYMHLQRGRLVVTGLSNNNVLKQILIYPYSRLECLIFRGEQRPPGELDALLKVVLSKKLHQIDLPTDDNNADNQFKEAIRMNKQDMAFYNNLPKYTTRFINNLAEAVLAHSIKKEKS